MSLWTKKPMSILQAEASETGVHTLKRSLGALNLTLLGIGAIIGAGIFVLTGVAAAKYAGPAIVLSFVLAGFGCLFAGLCYAEFASMIPIAGSAYTYGYATLGEFFAWIIGWDLILEYLFAASTVSVGWSGYFRELVGQLGLHIPARYSLAPLDVVEGTNHIVRATMCVDPTTGSSAVDAAGKVITAAACQAPNQVVEGLVNLPAMGLVAFLTLILVVGIKESATFNNVIVFVKMAIVVLVIGFGFMYVNTDNWHPFIPANTGPGTYGWSGILRGAGVVFFAYIGFDAVSTAAQEAKNPQRDLPIGILASLAVCTVLYILMALVMTGLVHYPDLDT
ncbi:MAG TPA: amino acid permease, partial [Gemmatimonadaceae bacterium]|nr:amino acid permease [Gemmatimonadaceae bacterium]